MYIHLLLLFYRILYYNGFLNISEVIKITCVIPETYNMWFSFSLNWLWLFKIFAIHFITLASQFNSAILRVVLSFKWSLVILSQSLVFIITPVPPCHPLSPLEIFLLFFVGMVLFFENWSLIFFRVSKLQLV